MDMSYATILVFTEQRRLYKENRLEYMISNTKCPQNQPMYSVDTNLGSTIFCIDVLMGEKIPHNKGCHYLFHMSQLESRTFCMACPTRLWTYYHLRVI